MQTAQKVFRKNLFYFIHLDGKYFQLEVNDEKLYYNNKKMTN